LLAHQNLSSAVYQQAGTKLRERVAGKRRLNKLREPSGELAGFKAEVRNGVRIAQETGSEMSNKM
jgi:hypothetical protein